MNSIMRQCVAVAVFGAAGAIVACSGSDRGGSGQYDSCLSSFLGSSCTACIQSHCGGALSSLETGCGDYLGCICPGGSFSASNAESQTCASKLGESSCTATTQADGGATSCAACDSACGSSTGSSNGFGGSSSSSSGSSSTNSGSSSGSSSGGNTTGSSSGSSGSSSGGSSDCATTLLPGSSAVTLSLTGVDLGDTSTSDWESIGYNLDGFCTTASSTNVCALTAGAPLQEQDDGANGIDNSFGENLCPLFEALSSNHPCGAGIQQAYLQIDASGAGSLVLSFGSSPLVYPVRDVHLDMGASGGMAGGVIPTAGLTAAWQSAAGCISTSLCSGSAIQSVLTQLAQASDIGADGSNTEGAGCDGVSFGIKFTGSTPVTSIPSAPTCPCQ